MGYRLGQWHISLTIVFVILGFLLATAFSTQQRWGERAGPRKQNLVDFIKKQRVERDALGDQLIKLRKEIDKLDLAQAGRLDQQSVYGRQLERLKLKAGLKAVGGPGLEITIGDAARVPLGADPDSYLIHDYDIQIIVNALWRGGAEAMALNGERFVINTGIRSAGSTILINSKPQGGPYKIKAIGDPERLLNVLKQDSDAALLVGDYAQRYGLVVKKVRRRRLTVPPFKGSLKTVSKGTG